MGNTYWEQRLSRFPGSESGSGWAATGAVTSPPAMVMSSRFVLQARPLSLPARFFSLTSHHPRFSTCSAQISGLRRHAVEAHAAVAIRALGNREFGSPGWRIKEAGCSGRKNVSSCGVSSSAMAGACGGPPPQYRGNVGICLINDKNEVSINPSSPCSILKVTRVLI